MPTRRPPLLELCAFSLSTVALLACGCAARKHGLRLFDDAPIVPRSQLRRFDPADPLQRRAAEDPLAFLKMCRAHCAENYADYRCRFIKQERLNGALTDVQEMAVRFRAEPYSVQMRWVRNPGPARKVTYVEGRWARDGREVALIHPSGLLALVAPRGVKRDIRAPDVRAAARGTIDEFGFQNTLDSIIEECERAGKDAKCDLRFVGTATLDGRPCLVFERLLPYTGPDGPYPDRLQIVYIDREWLVPLGCFAFADKARRELLGRYVTTNVQFNVGLTDEDF